jgi:hypothetical protein
MDVSEQLCFVDVGIRWLPSLIRLMEELGQDLELVDAAAHQRLLARGFSCSMVRPSRRCFPSVTMASVEDLDASRSRGRRWTLGTNL